MFHKRPKPTPCGACNGTGHAPPDGKRCTHCGADISWRRRNAKICTRPECEKKQQASYYRKRKQQ